MKAALSMLLLLCAVVSRGEVIELTNPISQICITGPGAVFTVQNGALRPVEGRFSIFPDWRQPLQAKIAAPAAGQPGQLMRVYISSEEPLGGVSIQLGKAGARPLGKSAGFRYSSSGNQELWAGLVGIPPEADTGEYTLTVRAEEGLRSFLLVQPFTVQPRSFSVERVGLTRDLTQLLTTPDPKKTAQSLSLARLLATAHPDAVLETSAFATPLAGARRTAGYGDRREYVYSDNSTELSIHQGVDIASPAGTPVPACGRGRVAFAGFRLLTGNTVVIEHLPGLFSLYFHMSSLLVKEGVIVEKGQTLGNVGMTGLATGPHLHWEVEAFGTAVDPDALVSGPLLDMNPVFPDIGSRTSTEGR